MIVSGSMIDQGSDQGVGIVKEQSTTGCTISSNDLECVHGPLFEIEDDRLHAQN
jgi:hypothetical protein